MSELLPLDLAVLPVLHVGLLLAVRDEPAHQASSLTTNILAIQDTSSGYHHLFL